MQRVQSTLKSTWIDIIGFVVTSRSSCQYMDCTRELHGDGDDGITAVMGTVVMGLDFTTDTAIIAGMGTTFMVVSWSR